MAMKYYSDEFKRDRKRRGIAAAVPAEGGTPAARAGQTTSSVDPDERTR